jgi:uncharacterized protein
MTQQPMSTDITSDDKLWAALGYPIWPIALIMLLMEEKKKRPFIKFHAIQSLAVNVVIVVVGVIITAITIGVGGLCWGVFWLVTIWPAVLAYQGKYFDIPVITKFMRGQHWVS